MTRLFAALFVLVGCGGDAMTPGDPTGACEASATSQTLTLDAGSADERIWGLESCTDLGGDVWRQAWRSDGWLLEVEGGPLVGGEVAATDVSILVQESDGTVWTGDLATIDVQSYGENGPCGRWTTNPLELGADLMSVSPQPVGFDCTLLE